ncbi:unnamed protein product [Cochlearia groenlandica]
MAPSSLSQLYTDFTFSGVASSQLMHGSSSSSSSPDVSTLSNYVDNMSYNSINATFNQESMFLPDYNNYYYHNIGINNATQYFHGGDQDYYSFSPDNIKPLFRARINGEQSWGNSSEGGIKAGETNTKVRQYSAEERKDKIMRYLKKKNQRNFNKTIKYVCRKTLADRRVRVRGRFARNNDMCDDQRQYSPMSKSLSNHSSDDYLIHMENDDGWFNEAMSTMISFPHDLDTPGDAHHPS